MANSRMTFFVLNILFYVFECYIVNGKTLDPIYWNSSNPMFKILTRRRHYDVNAAINDKLDVICPRKDRGDGEDLFYFKLYLVSEENYRKCNASGGIRLLTCDVPEREKKYTFFFQEISPSPWGLEFKPGKSYYVISTSDGSLSGIDGLKGGVCTRFNMKIELKIHSKEDANVVPPIHRPKQPTPGRNVQRGSNMSPNPNGQPKLNHFNSKNTGSEDIERENNQQPKVEPADNPPSGNDANNVTGNGLIIGIVLGACAVLFILLLSFLGYKVYRRRRQHKKYQSPPMTPRGNTPMQQVTLLPIAPPSRHVRLHSEVDRHPRTPTLTSHPELRPPPSYNESFLDNGGPVVAV